MPALSGRVKSTEMPNSAPASPTASRDDRIGESVWTLLCHLTRTRPICRRLIWAPCRPSARAAEGLFVLWSSFIFWPAALSSDLLQPVDGQAKDSRGLWSLMVQVRRVCRSHWGSAVVCFLRRKKVTVNLYAPVCATLRDTGKRTIMSPRWPHATTSRFFRVSSASGSWQFFFLFHVSFFLICFWFLTRHWSTIYKLSLKIHLI